MIIASYEVQASSQHSYQKVESHISQTGWVKESELFGGAKAGETETPVLLDLSKQTAKQLAEQAQKDKQAQNGAQNGAQKETQKESQNEGLKDQFKAYKPAPLKWSAPIARNLQEVQIQLLEAMIFALTGKRISAKPLAAISDNGAASQHGAMNQGMALNANRPEAMRQVTQTEHFYYESESVSYQAKGLIQTADGKSISVDVSMQMSREFVSYSSTSVLWEKPKDPLVINYAGTAASLTEQKYSFDLTMDGNMEQMSFVGPGSGFLAVDWNEDGSINDGSELFGPQSGDGFEDLRAFDGDGNGWIDEADDIFSKLLVWSKDEDGNDQLFSLKDLDIGAIYLGNVDTQFSMNDEENTTHGVMRTTSFFLKESGGGGTLSQIDLMI